MEKSFQDTKEAVVGALALAAVLIEAFKDGVQAHDFVAIMAKYQSDADFKAKIDAAVADIAKAKTSQLTPAEIIELLSAIIKEAPALIQAIEKK